jgi:hypothetical protein
MVSSTSNRLSSNYNLDKVAYPSREMYCGEFSYYLEKYIRNDKNFSCVGFLILANSVSKLICFIQERKEQSKKEYCRVFLKKKEEAKKERILLNIL